MKLDKQNRRQRALARFRIMPINEWREANNIPFNTTNDHETLGDILTDGLYNIYVERKKVELASLRAA